MNCISQRLESGFLNLNWETSLDHGAPSESTLNSVISSAAPATTSFSSNALCYGGGMPLNSPPELYLSGVLENPMLTHPTLAPFSTNPGFVERAAEKHFRQRPMLGMGSGNLSRVSSSQSLKIGTQMGALDKKETALLDGLEVVSGSALASDRKFGVISRSSTPDSAELGNGRDESSPSDIDMGLNGQPEISARKRKAISRAKAKELPSSSSSAKDYQRLRLLFLLQFPKITVIVLLISEISTARSWEWGFKSREKQNNRSQQEGRSEREFRKGSWQPESSRWKPETEQG